MQEWNESEGAVNAVIPRLPPWAAEPFSRYIENQRMAHRMLEIIKQSVVHTAEVIDATAPDGEFLRTLQTDDFAFLHASSTVTLWSTLEHTIDTLLIAWLVNRSDDIEADQASKIRVPLGEFLPLNAERRADYIFERIEKEYATGKKGTTR